MAKKNSFLSAGEKFGLGGCLGFILLGMASAAGLITHIVHCLKTHEWLLLLIGVFGPPIGVIHGWGLWFGWWG